MTYVRRVIRSSYNADDTGEDDMNNLVTKHRKRQETRRKLRRGLPIIPVDRIDFRRTDMLQVRSVAR